MGLTELLVKVGANIQEFKKEFSEVDRTLGAVGRTMTDAGTRLTVGLTAPIVALGGFALKSAIEFESAMAQVAKVTGLAEEPLKAVSNEIREMSKTVPMSAKELALLAAVSAQLGIKVEDLTKFTQVMSDLGQTTDLSAEQAAQALAQFSNVIGISGDDFDKLGSAIVELGVRGAATESSIVFMAQRIAATAKTVGLSAPDILAFSSALADAGIEADAGGSAISRTFAEMSTAVAKGGHSLDQFAEVAGVSGAVFKDTFEKDAGGALLLFVQGLARMKEEGKSTVLALLEMGITEVRQRNAILALTADTERLSEKMNLSADAFDKGTAASERAAKIYGTTESQLKILRNRLTDVLIGFGDELVPMLRNVLEAGIPVVNFLADAVKFFSALPGPVKTTIVVFAGLAAALGPVLLITGQMIQTFLALKTLLAGAGIAMGTFSLVAVGVVAAIVAIVAVATLIVKHWDEIKAATVRLVEGLRDAFILKFGPMIEFVKKGAEIIVGAFKFMYDKVVGNSYVPDLIKGIGREFAKLDKVAGDPTRRTVASIVEAWKEAGNKVTPSMDLLARVYEKQASLIERIRDLRFDLTLADSSEKADNMRAELAKASVELERINGLAAKLEPLRLKLEESAKAAFELKTALDQIKDPELKMGSSMGRTSEETVGSMKFASTQIGALGTVTERATAILSSFSDGAIMSTSFLDKFGRVVQELNVTVMGVGKKLLGGVVGVVGTLFEAMNPITVVATVFDQAIRNATTSNVKMKESMDRMVGIIVEALAPALDALGPVFDALTPIIADLAPLIAAVAEIFAALFKAVAPILHAAVPLLKALFPAFKFVAIIATYLGQAFAFAGKIIFTIASFIAKAVGTVIKGIGSLIDKIPGLGDFGLKKAGQSLIDLGDSFKETAQHMDEAFDELGDAREEIKKISLDEPVAKAKEGLTDVGDAAHIAAEAINELTEAAGGHRGGGPKIEVHIGSITVGGGADGGGGQIAEKIIEDINTGLGYAELQENRLLGVATL